MKFRVALALGFGCLGCIPGLVAHAQTAPVSPDQGRQADVSLWEWDASARTSFPTFEKAFLNGAFLAAGDVDGDGRSELIVGAGPGRMPDVRIYATDGTLKKTFRAYPEWFKGGVRVAAADLDGDGKDEIVTAPGPGIEPQLNAFDASGKTLVPGGVLAYIKEFKGGVRIASGDLDGDGKDEVVTAPGPGGGPHIRVFHGPLEPASLEFFAFDEGMKDGVTIAVTRAPSGPEIVVGVESWSAPLIRRFGVSQGLVLMKEFQTFDTGWRSGVSVSAFDWDGDDIDEIAAVGNGGTSPEVRIYDIYGTLAAKYLLHEPSFRGSLSLAEIDADGDGRMELASSAVAPVVNGPLDKEKFISVNLSQQRLYAFEHGRTARTFLVSTGSVKYPTQVMQTVVQEKIFKKDYRWSYGPGHPDNYHLPNVKWNLRIKGPIHIHYAYWHNNFGRRMSHGCINAGKADAEWIYNWSDVGLPVETKY